jgi:hypothetical protein
VVRCGRDCRSSGHHIKASEGLIEPATVLRFKSSYEFHFEGFSNFSLSTQGLVRIQDINVRIKKWNRKLVVLNLCMDCVVHVSSIM